VHSDEWLCTHHISFKLVWERSGSAFRAGGSAQNALKAFSAREPGPKLLMWFSLQVVIAISGPIHVIVPFGLALLCARQNSSVYLHTVGSAAMSQR
jgi:hypothetical protein